MRNIYRILLLSVLACSAGAAHAENEVSYLSQIGISGREVVKQDREVQLSMQVDMSRLRIRTQHTVALTPVLVSEDGSREAAFPPIVIDGGTRNRVYLRAQRLESVELPPYHDESSQVIIRRRNGRPPASFMRSVIFKAPASKTPRKTPGKARRLLI